MPFLKTLRDEVFNTFRDVVDVVFDVVEGVSGGAQVMLKKGYNNSRSAQGLVNHPTQTLNPKLQCYRKRVSVSAEVRVSESASFRSSVCVRQRVSV